MAKSELDILSSAFSAQRLSKYLAYNHGDVDRTVTHYKANMRLAESLYITEIDKARALIRNRGEKVTTDKIISEMTFGFWVMLLNSQYERVLWKSLRKAFQNMPKKDRQRKNVSAPCNSLRHLRNRIFHQEAICWDLFYVTCLHDNLRTVLGWMNADMPEWLAKIDPFDNVSADIRKEMGWR